MRKSIKALLGIFLAVFMTVSLMAIPSSAVSLSKTTVTLTKGYQTTLTVSGASSVTWSTGDKSIATVSKGKVVGKAPGTTYIYAKAGGTTLKCKVNVVPSKITASKSTVNLDKAGDTQIVTMTIKGSHNGISIGSTDKSVATASWVKPVQWDGDKIKIKITAKGEGDARIKVYSKSYSSTCYKYIDVSVGSSLFEDDDNTDSTSSMVILPYSQNVDVAAGGTVTLQVYCSDLTNLGYTVTNSNLATVTEGTTSGKYRNFSIKGISNGTATLRFYDKKNTKKYVDVTVKVGGDVKYYELYTTKPATTLASTDRVINYQVSSTLTYYMVVPANYDPAYANTILANKINKYSYYTVYSEVPARSAATDSYQFFTHSNSKYNYGTRYVLLPDKYDQVKYNTIVANYNERYDYYTVYNESPILQDKWDLIKTWNVNDSTGKSVTRYMLVPYNFDQAKVDDIMGKDKNANNTFSYYIAYSKYPTVNTETDNIVMYTKNGSWRYMVVPKKGLDILKRNDEIKKDTGVFEQYIMYSESPKADASKGEEVRTIQYGSKFVYVLCVPSAADHDARWANITTAAPSGT